jgi:hypothetical protein
VAATLLLGKALYAVFKDTKDYCSLLLYFIALYKERSAAVDASAKKEDATADINKQTL